MNVKWYAIVGIFFILMSASAQAESMYVGEIIEITLRTGPGIDHKVIAMVRSGQVVEVLEPGPEWTGVRLQNEKEGYVLSRFLTNKKPNELLLSELKKKYRALEEKVESLRDENNRQNEENKNLNAEFGKKEKLLARITDAYETLRKESAEFINLKTNYKRLTTELNEQTNRAEEFGAALTKLQKRQIFRWVLTGAGILLVGFLIGMSSRRQRRRSSLL